MNISDIVGGDECQMIADPTADITDQGSAGTSRAEEIHLCMARRQRILVVQMIKRC